MSETKTEQTEVSQVDINLDDIFGGTPGADSVMLPDSGEEKEEKRSQYSQTQKWI